MPNEFLDKLTQYAKITPHIESVIIVGSYARGTNKETSDLDVVIISSNKSEMVANQNFTQELKKPLI